MKRPDVLLLGNGLNNAFDGTAWNALIHKMAKRDDLPEQIALPYPLQILLATCGDYAQSLQGMQDALVGVQPQGDFLELLHRLLDMGFDDILTTNYSYELERAAFPKELDSVKTRSRVQRMQATTAEHAEPRYMLHTFNQAGENRIWHIHGEARKPQSMIIGHYEYASLLSRLKAHSDERKDAYQHLEEEPLSELSWVDQFILGNVYVLGFGFDPSEMDLWWLLNRKRNERAEHGKVYFYEPHQELPFNAKIELLKTMGVEVRDLGMMLSKDRSESAQQYKVFYPMAIADIEKTKKQEEK